MLDNQKSVPIPNGTSSESSWRDGANADLFGTDAIPRSVGSIEHGKSAQGDVIYIYTVVHGSSPQNHSTVGRGCTSGNPVQSLHFSLRGLISNIAKILQRHSSETCRVTSRWDGARIACSCSQTLGCGVRKVQHSEKLGTRVCVTTPYTYGRNMRRSTPR